MLQRSFANRMKEIAQADESITGLAIGGSWLSNDMDEFSDLDIVLFTRERVSDNKTRMLQYANSFGKLLSAFTGEHVGEPRLLICLYDEPLLHVDIKFLVKEEFARRVENPELLFDRTGELGVIMNNTRANFPYPNYQWIEDRIWTWVHYIAQKIARGEYMDVMDVMAFVRAVVLGPLMHIKNGNLPRGVRKLETLIEPEDYQSIKKTLEGKDKNEFFGSLDQVVKSYRLLRKSLYPDTIVLNKSAEERVLEYVETLKKRS